MELNKTVFTPKTDPLFFLYLERLSMAEKLKDNKDDRVDGRRALNDFILEHESIVHTKSVKKAEAQKLQHQQNLKESKYLNISVCLIISLINSNFLHRAF